LQDLIPNVHSALLHAAPVSSKLNDERADGPELREPDAAQMLSITLF
jgi:hypothetical protein